MSVRAWWWTGVDNAGDRLTPYVLKHFCDLDVEHSSLTSADVVGIGSVLGLLPHEWTGTILGAGHMHQGMPLRAKQARILALRGPLSAIGIPGDYALGDPGILAAHLIPSQSKRFKLGIVPHWSDSTLRDRAQIEWGQYDPLWINVRNHPLTVIAAIASCDKIITSSLHGMIFADSLGIPRRFEYPKRFDREGGVFKLRDYSRSIRMRFELGKTMTANRFAVERVQEGLIDALRAYTTIAKTHGESTN